MNHPIPQGIAAEIEAGRFKTIDALKDICNEPSGYDVRDHLERLNRINAKITPDFRPHRQHIGPDRRQSIASRIEEMNNAPRPGTARDLGTFFVIATFAFTIAALGIAGLDALVAWYFGAVL